MPSFAEIYADELIVRTIDLFRVDANLRQRALWYLNDLRKIIEHSLKTLDPTKPQKLAFQQRRLKNLFLIVNKSIKDYIKNSTDDLENLLKEVIESELTFTPKSMNSVIGVDLISATITPSILTSIVKSDILGAPLKEHWGRIGNNYARAFSDQMRIGVGLGENLNELVQRVRGTSTGRYKIVQNKKGVKSRLYQFDGGILNRTTREAEALVRTSVMHMANDARMHVYEENSNMIRGYQAVVTLDNRTTLICIGYSGNKWDLEGNPIEGTTKKFPKHPPWHVNCRSILVPLLKELEELTKKQQKAINLAEPKFTRASMDGSVLSKMNYEQWLKTKSVSFQKDVLGKGRYERWKSGKINNLSGLTDQTGRPLTIVDLKKEYNKKGDR